MANMHFKADLLPSTDLGYSLGSSNERWKINGLTGGPIEYIVGTQTASTGSWTGITKDPTLVTGKVIAYKLPYAGSGSASLTLTYTNPPTGEATNSGAIPVYLNNTRATTHYAANSVIIMVYDGTNWRSTDYWNSDSRDAGYGKINLTQSTSIAELTTNTTQIAAHTYNEVMTLAAGNKWVQFAGTNSNTNGADILTVAHSLSGVTPSSYGDSSNQTPAYGGTFNVPYITVDAAGHVTAISTHTVKIPASDNTNNAVTQTNQTGNNDYRILLSGTANDTTATEGANKSTNLRFNPSTKVFSVGGDINTTGDLIIAHATTATMTSASTNPKITFSENGTQPVHLIYSDWDSYRSPAGLKVIGGTSATPAWFEVEGNIYAAAFKGNADTATKLKTARSINGTNFDGSGNITTTNWGTSRTLTIGSTGKSVNGSENVSWSLSEIGAAASSHSHATLTIGNATYNGSSATTISIADLGLSTAINFLGVTTTDVGQTANQNASTVAIVGGSQSQSVSNGDVVVVQSTGKEYVYVSAGSPKWQELGLATSYALQNHIHGNITNTGTITSDTTIANGHKLVITDGNGKICRSGLAFTSSTSKFLREDGTWATAITADEKVKQLAAITTAGNYPVLLGYSTATTAVTNTVNKASTLTYNPSTKTLNINSGAGTINGVASSATKATQDGAGNTITTTYVKKAGDTMTGTLTTHGLVGTLDIDYGEVLPTSAVNGQVFFQLSDGYNYELPSGGTTGQALIKSSNNDGDVSWASPFVLKTGDTMTGSLTCGNIYVDNQLNPDGNTQGHGVQIFHTAEGGNIAIYAGKSGITDNWRWEIDAYNGDLRAYCSKNGSYVSTPISVKSNGVYGAVWNDYAEFRETKEKIEPGRCIREIGNDTLELTTNRLQPGCEIVSDTFGFAIGETEECKTPVAASGRVLAYPYEDREEFRKHIGEPVCSGPNGTVSIMTHEEEKEWPSRIIGVISAVPDYKEWGTGKVKVNGRIWIRIK